MLLIVFGLLFVIIAYLIYTIYTIKKPLSQLSSKLSGFDMKNPKLIECDKGSNLEIEQITSAINSMIKKIISHTTDLEELNSKLLMREIHLKDAQRMAHIGSWEYQLHSGHFEMSTQMRRILGLKSSEVFEDFESFVHYLGDSKEDFLSELDYAINSGSTFKLRHKLTASDGKVKDILTQGKVRKKSSGAVRITAISMDISEQIATQEMIEKLAYYDALTSLPNRTLFNDRLNKALAHAKRTKGKLAVMFLDLDHFKLINDTLGHHVGDELLKSVALQLSALLREDDTISRVGGDEFTILLHTIRSQEDAANVAKKIIALMKQKWMIHTHALHVTTSVGIAIYPDDAKDAQTLIAHADTAMYHAKSLGRDSFSFFLEDMQEKNSNQLELEGDIRHALEHGGEFFLCYQPKIELVANRIVGVEALVRWNHPTRGIIYPDTFIPLAESTGIIIELGEWVITEAIRQIQRWQDEDNDVKHIAINLSSRQFQSQRLLAYIEHEIAKYKIVPEYLEFEITESISMANIKESLRIMSALKAMGVTISIDDFGTGYSSLSYLKQFPIDTLKVDKSFVLDMLEDEEDKIMVQTIISLAHSLGMKVVAEGVESRAHVKELIALGCDYAQGYYYAKALKERELKDYLDGYNLI